jgi:hypothetical protein
MAKARQETRNFAMRVYGFYAVYTPLCCCYTLIHTLIYPGLKFMPSSPVFVQCQMTQHQQRRRRALWTERPRRFLLDRGQLPEREEWSAQEHGETRQ